jgi:hypothetical protein
MISFLLLFLDFIPLKRQSVINILDKLIMVIDSPSSDSRGLLSAALESSQDTIIFHAPGQTQCAKALASFSSITQVLKK